MNISTQSVHILTIQQIGVPVRTFGLCQRSWPCVSATHMHTLLGRYINCNELQ